MGKGLSRGNGPDYYLDCNYLVLKNKVSLLPSVCCSFAFSVCVKVTLDYKGVVQVI